MFLRSLASGTLWEPQWVACLAELWVWLEGKSYLSGLCVIHRIHSVTMPLCEGGGQCIAS